MLVVCRVRVAPQNIDSEEAFLEVMRRKRAETLAKGAPTTPQRTSVLLITLFFSLVLNIILALAVIGSLFLPLKELIPLARNAVAIACLVVGWAAAWVLWGLGKEEKGR